MFLNPINCSFLQVYAAEYCLLHYKTSIIEVGTIITQNLHRLSPSYDYIIGSLLFCLTFIQNKFDLRKKCDILKSYIGGTVARAADMLRDEWDQVRLII